MICYLAVWWCCSSHMLIYFLIGKCEPYLSEADKQSNLFLQMWLVLYLMSGLISPYQPIYPHVKGQWPSLSNSFCSVHTSIHSRTHFVTHIIAVNLLEKSREVFQTSPFCTQLKIYMTVNRKYSCLKSCDQ